ncbi:ABC transporter substrate-binding protein [Streptomyces sp. TP-A0874]|uniref:ABC transporter substrate-binding protein n=1 Tax=Streptomyces sp. TP-A0874 TaxID=549819 RepID=UPI000852903D|nr:iron-siderophore ABC transporter substrate-binding protein [Streptomyces sp. TP-A0874]
MRSSRSVSRRTAVAAAAVAAASALLLTACGAEDPESGGAGESSSKTRTVTDVTGAKVEIPGGVEKVVVLSEMDLDSSLALGVKPVGLSAGRGQQGAPEYLGDATEGIPVVGAVTGPDIEKVASAGPDVILAGQIADKQVLEQLRTIAPTVVTVGKDRSWKKSLKLTAEALGKEAEVEKFVRGYEERVESVKQALGDRSGAEVSVARYSARGTAVMQQGVFISDVLNDLGLKRPGIQNDQGEGHSTPVGDEDIKQIDGDWLFIGTLASTGEDADLFRKLKEKPAYRQLSAVKNDHVTEVDGSKWTSLGGAEAAMSVLDDIEEAMAG